jgi:hypothetical protein
MVFHMTDEAMNKAWQKRLAEKFGKFGRVEQHINDYLKAHMDEFNEMLHESNKKRTEKLSEDAKHYDISKPSYAQRKPILEEHPENVKNPKTALYNLKSHGYIPASETKFKNRKFQDFDNQLNRENLKLKPKIPKAVEGVKPIPHKPHLIADDNPKIKHKKYEPKPAKQSKKYTFGKPANGEAIPILSEHEHPKGMKPKTSMYNKNIQADLKKNILEKSEDIIKKWKK